MDGIRTLTLDLPLNRVEGDLDVRLQCEGGIVTDAFSRGTLYRGFEEMMVGRAALDGLVLTPRVCGICSTSHLRAAAEALESVIGCRPPANALRVRNATLMAEIVQSDLRQSLLMFCGDFTRPSYAGSPLYDEAVRRFRPFEGTSVQEAARATREVLDLVTILGGQWPHSSFMVPGGVTTLPSTPDLRRCAFYVEQSIRWYERQVLGCTLERWAQVDSRAGLEAWLDESPAHRDGDLGFFLRFATAHGLDRLGAGTGNHLSYGSLPVPGGEGLHVPAGVVLDGAAAAFDPGEIAEAVDCSWFRDQPEPLHPSRGSTVPAVPVDGDPRYSWAKAPRYAGRACETGPLSERIVAGDPLFTDLAGPRGNVLARQLARMVRAADHLPTLRDWLMAIDRRERFHSPCDTPTDGSGFGLLQAPRGGLGHWLTLRDQRIERYQIVCPTTWNASPRDGAGARGPLEEALVGTPMGDPDDPVQVEHVVRSFDPCLVCTVH